MIRARQFIPLSVSFWQPTRHTQFSSMQTESTTKPPPNTFFGILSYLGPGLIIAASIVGSGELIATTLTGARGGLILLWLIILGCVVKVFAQIEIGRYTVSTGVPTLSAQYRSWTASCKSRQLVDLVLVLYVVLQHRTVGWNRR